ncbi:MAG: hypothetical protein WBE76_18695 [Terracidiphilus sp.]
MTMERVDQILAGEDETVPSSGFAASVMERIESEAAIPPPIPFPWMRALPGMLLAAGGFGWCIFELARLGFASASHAPAPSFHLTAALDRPLEQAGWVALALGASLASWLVSKRMAGRSGLL